MFGTAADNMHTCKAVTRLLLGAAALEMVGAAAADGHELACRDRLRQPFASDSPWK